MKVVILAGGLGTRLAEETEVKPKPMVLIGGRPIIWHIMKHYAQYGFKEFVIALGYKGDVIKRYFLEYHRMDGDLTVRIGNGDVKVHNQAREDWTVHLVDTGQKTLTGGRIHRLKHLLDRETFMVTYGDGVGNVDLRKLLAFHRSQRRIVTITAVHPPSRFGGLSFKKSRLLRFKEKPQTEEGWISGGFMVCEPKVFKYLTGDRTNLEADTLEKLGCSGQLAAYRHQGFWQCMDTLRDVSLLESLWNRKSPPWKTWE